MKNLQKSKQELSDIANKAWATRRKNSEIVLRSKDIEIEKRKKELSDRANKAWITRKKNAEANFKFKNTEGKEKDRIRDKKTFSYLDSGIIEGFLFFMPSQTCDDVFRINRLIPNNNFTFLGNENCPKAINEIKRKTKEFNLKLHLYPYSVREHLNYLDSDSLAHADFDMCETFSIYKGLVSKTVEKNLVKKKGIISMTFATRDKNINTIATKILGGAKVEQLKNDHKSLVFSTLLKFLQDLCLDGRYAIYSMPEVYTDNKDKKGNQMIFAQLQRIKD